LQARQFLLQTQWFGRFSAGRGPKNYFGKTFSALELIDLL
jgi:hypothetical protein